MSSILPKKKTIILGEEEKRIYTIGKLSVTQQHLLKDFIAEVILVSQEKLTRLQDETRDNKSNAQDMLAIIKLLTPKEHLQLFSILLKENDINFLDKNLGLAEQSDIVLAVCENNDFDNVKKNISKIKNLFQTKR